MIPQLEPLGRRVLGHLPVWAQDEAQHVTKEGGTKRSVRSYNLAEMTGRLGEDPDALVTDDQGIETRHQTEPEVLISLQALEASGLADRIEVDGEDRWKMSQLGYEAITAPPNTPEQVPGQMTVPLHPARNEGTTRGKVSA